MAALALGRIGRLPLAGLFTVSQAAGYFALSIPIGSVLGFVASGVYEPFARRPVDHLKAAGYAGLLFGWFTMCFCGLLVVIP
jgi:hypothetical protein